jgi:hypothetical protein
LFGVVVVAVFTLPPMPSLSEQAPWRHPGNIQFGGYHFPWLPPPPPPDLMITSTSAQKLKCGGNYQVVFKIGATVTNVGTGPAVMPKSPSGAWIGVWDPSYQGPVSMAFSGGSAILSQLLPGNAKTFFTEKSFYQIGNRDPGWYIHYCVAADPKNWIFESDEYNNTPICINTGLFKNGATVCK